MQTMMLARPLLAVSLVLAGLGPAPARADAPMPNRLTGSVSDASGAVLPGVTVTATAVEAGVSHTTHTDGAGRYDLAEIPAATYVVSFALDGFRPAEETGIVVRDGHVIVRNRKLELGGLEETITIVATAPPARANRIVSTPRRLPELQPVPEHAPLSVCGPRQAQAGEAAVGAIVRLHGDAGRFLLGDRDVIVLDAGGAGVLQVGQHLVVRRRFTVPGLDPADTRSRPEQTAALIQVVAVEPHATLARVVYVCSEIAVGDYVSPFEPQRATAMAGGAPDFEDPARVLFADAGRTVGAPADFMVIDRGRNQATQAGQRLTLFRRGTDGTISPLGTGMVVAVQHDTATIRIETARDVVEVTDQVAFHR